MIPKQEVVDYKFYLYLPYKESYIFVHNFNLQRVNYLNQKAKLHPFYSKFKGVWEPFYNCIMFSSAEPVDRALPIIALIVLAGVGIAQITGIKMGEQGRTYFTK